jgi:hypothetical protein
MFVIAERASIQNLTPFMLRDPLTLPSPPKGAREVEGSPTDMFRPKTHTDDAGGNPLQDRNP